MIIHRGGLRFNTWGQSVNKRSTLDPSPFFENCKIVESAVSTPPHPTQPSSTQRSNANSRFSIALRRQERSLYLLEDGPDILFLDAKRHLLSGIVPERHLIFLKGGKNAAAARRARGRGERDKDGQKAGVPPPTQHARIYTRMKHSQPRPSPYCNKKPAYIPIQPSYDVRW